MLEAWADENGIFMGNIFISNNVDYLECATAKFTNFDTLIVSKDYKNKRYIALMFLDDIEIGFAYGKFRNEKSNEFFESWLKEHKIPLIDLEARRNLVVIDGGKVNA